MASQRTKFTVGLFVASGIGISLIAIIWLGMARYWEKGHFYVAYFDESVQGLSKDSPVKYRGVSIGRVESIKVAPDSKLIQVLLKIESKQPLDKSIVAQLKDVGITGSMFVELDRKKEGDPDRSPRVTFPSEYPILASKPSELSQLLKGLDDVLNHIKSIDLAGISDKLKLTLDSVNQIITEVDVRGLSGRVQSSLDHIDQMVVSADVKGLSTTLQATLEGANRLLDAKRWNRILASVEEVIGSINLLSRKAGTSLRRLDETFITVEGVVAENREGIKQAVAGLQEAVGRANILLEKGTSFISGADDSLFELRRRLSVTAQNLEKATENLNNFLEILGDHPSQLVFGEPPVPRNVGQDEREH